MEEQIHNKENLLNDMKLNHDSYNLHISTLKPTLNVRSNKANIVVQTFSSVPILIVPMLAGSMIYIFP